MQNQGLRSRSTLDNSRGLVAVSRMRAAFQWGQSTSTLVSRALPAGVRRTRGSMLLARSASRRGAGPSSSAASRAGVSRPLSKFR